LKVSRAGKIMLVSVALAVMFVGTVWLALVRAPSCDRREEAGASLE
jgi:hypothetical protein